MQNLLTQWEALQSRRTYTAEQLAAQGKVMATLNAVCESTGTTLDELRGTSMARRLTLPRQIAYYILRTQLHMTYEAIAVYLRRKNHTSVYHGVQHVQQWIEDVECFQWLCKLIRRIEGAQDGL